MSWAEYTLLRQLGSGAFGIVHLARVINPNSDFFDELVAIKTVSLVAMSDSEAKLAMSEVAILRNLNHPSVLRFIDCFIDHESQLCLVTEFVDGGDLNSLIRNARDHQTFIDNFVVVDICRQLLEGLAYLHANRVLHRDIKPSNIYVTSAGAVKIGDFGVSKLLTDSVRFTGTFIGTPFYVAPELCMGEKYGFAADIWALGVTLFELYCLKLPFTGNNVLALVGKIAEGNYDKELLRNRPASTAPPMTTFTSAPLCGEGVTSPAGNGGGGVMMSEDFFMRSQGLASLISSLVEQMLVLDPAERPSAAELLSTFFGAMTDAGEDIPLPPQLPEPDDLDDEIEALLTEGGGVQFGDGSSSSGGGGRNSAVAMEKLVDNVPWIKNALTLSTIALDEVDEDGGAGAVVIRMSKDGLEARTPGCSETPRRRTSVAAADHETGGSSSAGQGGASYVSTIFQDPVMLEQRLRERAVLYHRKRHEANRLRRQLEANRSAGAAAVMGPPLALAPAPAPAAQPQPLSVPPQSSPATTPPSKNVASARRPQSAALSSSLRDLVLSHPDLLRSIQRTAAAIVEREEQESEAHALQVEDSGGLFDAANPAAHLAAAPKQLVNVILTREQRVVPVKVPDGCSFKKLARRIKKALLNQNQQLQTTSSASSFVQSRVDDEGPDAKIDLQLSYLDSDADCVVVESQADWRHVLQDHSAHHKGQPISLRCAL